jgi:hypothetical protein
MMAKQISFNRWVFGWTPVHDRVSVRVRLWRSSGAYLVVGPWEYLDE